MTSGAGNPDEEAAPCAPLGSGLASCGGAVPDGVVGVGVGIGFAVGGVAAGGGGGAAV
jgi:hypothetical protein